MIAPALPPRRRRAPASRLALPIILMLAVVAAGCSSREARFASYVAKANEFLAAEDLPKASVETRNAMQIDPRHPEPYFIAGRIDERQQNWQMAVSYYTRVLEIAPQHQGARMRLARILLMANQRAEAERHVIEMLARAPEDTDALALRAVLAAARGDVTQSAADVRRVTDRLAGHPEAAVLVGGLLLGRQQTREALGILEAAVEANPTFLELRALLDRALAGRPDTQKREANLRRMAAIAPKRFDYFAALAAFQDERGNTAEAERTLREAIDAHPTEDARVLALIDLVAARQGVDAAIAALKPYIAARPRAHALRFRLADLYAITARMQEATRVYQEILGNERDTAARVQAQLQLAHFALVTGNRGEAARLVAAALKESPRHNGALVLRAQLALEEKNAVAAIGDLRAVLRDQPNSTQAVAALAAAHRMNGEPALAHEAILGAVKLNPDNIDLQLVLADHLSATGAHGAALAALDELIKRHPRSLVAYDAKSALHLRMQDPAGVENTYRTLKAAWPESPIGAYRLGLMYAARRNIEAAARELEYAIEKAPATPEYLVALVRLYAQEGKTDIALKRLQKSAGAQPGNSTVQLLLGEFNLAQGKLTEAKAAFDKAHQLNPKDAGPYLALSRMHIAGGRAAHALEVLEQGRRALPNEPALELARAELEQHVGNAASAIDLYEGLLARYPRSDLIANNLAFLLAERNAQRDDLDRALVLARRFERSTDPNLLDTLGWIQAKRGRFDEAAPILRKALVAAPNSPSVLYHLGHVLIKAGDAGEGRAFVKKALAAAEAFAERDAARALLAQQ